MRPVSRSGWLLLPLLACATAKPAESTTSTASAAPVPAAHRHAPPRLPEPPGLILSAATHPADHLLPGPCRTRRVSGTPGGQSIEVTTYRYDDHGKMLADEVVDGTGDVLRTGEAKNDRQGRPEEIVERTSDRKVAERIAYRRDAQGRLTFEERFHKADRKPWLSRTVERDASGSVSGETWKIDAATWKLNASVDASGEAQTLADADGKTRVKWLRGGAGNPLMESLTLPDGTPVQEMYDYGCFGVDESATTALAAACGPDVDACHILARLLGPDANSMGLAPDPALAESYRIRACHAGDADTCLDLSNTVADPSAQNGYAYHAMELSREACERGDLAACIRAERVAASASFDVDPGLRPALVRRVLELALKGCDAGDGKACLEAAQRTARADVARAADPEKARALYDRACKLGAEAGCRFLAGDER